MTEPKVQAVILNRPNTATFPAIAILALLSSYIADERPEGDRLGAAAEIAQFFSVGLVVLACLVLLAAAVGEIVTALKGGS